MSALVLPLYETENCLVAVELFRWQGEYLR